MALVISEGLCLKAPKLEKHVKNLKMDGWDFIIEYNKMKKGSGEKGEVKIKPDYKYLKDMLAGRPVLSHPSRPGGLRLRYGRGRTTGLAALAVSPATMRAVDDFLAIGTQIKIERPGKAGAITPCDSIEGPILLLKNGDLIQANTMAEADAVKSEIVEIVDLGEVLLPFGEFVENNHVLVQGDYCDRMVQAGTAGRERMAAAGRLAGPGHLRKGAGDIEEIPGPAASRTSTSSGMISRSPNC